MKISIIVPTLNEVDSIREFLADLRQRAPNAEVIVVDGSSSDDTAKHAIGSCDQLLQTTPGRARQMNLGASAANVNVFWFLHADAAIPYGAVSEIKRTLQDQHVVGGFFRIRFPRERFVYQLSDTIGHYLGLLVRIRYGDHGFFCRRADFFAAGGYPDLPLFEDAEFYRRMRRRGRTRHVRNKIITSPRRYERLGPYRLTASYLLLSTLYLLHVPIPVLSRIYSRLCVRAEEQPYPERSSTRE